MSEVAEILVQHRPVIGDHLPGSAAHLVMAGAVTRIDASFLLRHPQVQAVIRVGAGYDNVDTSALRAAGVTLAAADVSGDPSVAEWTLGAMLYLLRTYSRAQSVALGGDWGARAQLWGHSLRSRRIGIIGHGSIGAQVAQLCRAFGAEVLVWHPWSDRALPAGIERLDRLEDLLECADIVSLHCRLEPETRHLIGAEALARMKPDALLINSGRGALLDEEALAIALRAGHLAGVAIDTVASEPHPEQSPLAGAPRVLLTPHVAAYTVEGRRQLVDWAVAEALAWIRSGHLSPPTAILPSRAEDWPATEASDAPVAESDHCAARPRSVNTLRH
ncbi:NAD(P)-dependent oxidoreductase [Frigidibacter albus]|uniref:NAD(P)-dependent oxidoreductase n=1 Tax=Frigidibacter albus TaxID=1465486 RepID=UPI0027E47A82|nr:NAD(P)-dependent oxidoreductase [Frigidibacter albus]